MSTSNPKFTAVKTAMLLHMPFFASLLLDIMDVKIGKFPEKFRMPDGLGGYVDLPNTAGTDGRTIFFDEDFLAGLPIPEAVGLTCHEIGHAMWNHMARAKYYVDMGFDGQPFQPPLWNVAADFVINDMLTKCGIALPKGGLLDSKYTSDMGVEEVYRDLVKQQQKQQGGKGKGKGQGQGQQGPGQGDPQGNGGFDQHIYETAKISPGEMKRAIQSAVDTAKACGNMPGELKRFAEQMIEPTVDWREKLRHLVITRALRETSTWTRPHKRRLAAQRLYLARPSGFGCGTIVVVIDTSGSIGPKELTAFMSELADILRVCNPERVYVLGCDAHVASVVELPGDTDISSEQPEVKGGGGTDFRPPFDWVAKEGITPDALIYLTDMCGPFPDAAPGYPVIWGRTTETAAPWGETVDVKV